MTREFPDWQPFHLDAERSSPLELSGMRGSTLVLLALPEALETGWAARAVARIARRRAGRNRRLLLADLDVEHPRLHREIGVGNGEGAVDLLLYGASLRRVARPVEGDFLFVSAGTVPGDARSALTSPRLDNLVDGFAQARAELFLFLPWTSPARNAVLARARNLVVLAGADEVVGLELPDLVGLRVGAVLGPPPGGTAAPAPAPELEVAPPAEDLPPGEARPAQGAGAAAPDDTSAEAIAAARAPVHEEAHAAPDRRGEAEPASAPAGKTAEAMPAAAAEPAGDAAGETDAGVPAADPLYLLPTEPRPPLARDRDPVEFDALFGAMERDVEGPPVPVDPRPFRPVAVEPSEAVLREERRRKRRRRRRVVAAVAVALVGTVAAAVTGVLPVPGVPVVASFAGPDAPAGGEAVASAPADPTRGDGASGDGATEADRAVPAGTPDGEAAAPSASAPAAEDGGTSGASAAPEAGPTPSVSPTSEANAPVAAAAPAERGPAPIRTTSVAVGSWRDLATATEQAAAFGRRSGDVGFFLAPVLVDGREWFRLLADTRDPVPDDRLPAVVADAVGGEPSGWFIRRTRLAFDLGGAPTFDEARARVAELARAGIPAYVLDAGGAGDAASPRFRVYGGGYAGQGEAAHMRTFLGRRGVDDAPLVPRVGRLPASPSIPGT